MNELPMARETKFPMRMPNKTPRIPPIWAITIASDKN